MDVAITDSFDLDLGRRLFIIIAFLLVLWYGLNLLVGKMKSGSWQIPKFLLDRVPGLKHYSVSQEKELYRMEIIQRKQLPDGSELLVLDLEGRHILLSRHIQSGISYITDLNNR